MTQAELATAACEGADVKIVLINNSYLGMVRQWQELFYNENYFSVSVTQPDFCKLADAYGVKSIRVESKAEVASAIAEARAHDGPVLIDFHVDQQENVWPMVPAGASLSETIEIPEAELLR